MTLAIIIPAHNEEDNIAEVIKKIEGYLRLYLWAVLRRFRG